VPRADREKSPRPALFAGRNTAKIAEPFQKRCNPVGNFDRAVALSMKPAAGFLTPASEFLQRWD